MSFLIYQRSDPRYSDWLPLTTQQLRLRNLIQVIGLNFDPGEDDLLYYTLHLAPMSAPFYTSEKVRGGSKISWREIEPRQVPSYVPLSAPGFVIRIWSSSDGRSQPLTSWGVIMKGLHFLGEKGEWNVQGFDNNSIIFRMPYGYFTSIGCLIFKSKAPERFISIDCPKGSESSVRDSYSVRSLKKLHGDQRSLLEESEVARRLRIQIGSYGYSSESDLVTPPPIHSTISSLSRLPSLPKSISHFPVNPSNVLLRVQQGKSKLKLKQEIESKKLIVALLRDEKGRSEGRVQRLKLKSVSLEDTAGDLMARIHALGRERDRLREVKTLIHDKKQKLAERRSALNIRKKQLISELLLIYPMQLVEGSKRFSISEVQLPDAEDYGSESGGQISVALGYTAHLVAMLGYFLGMPLRYPIRHFGSRTRIIDHITSQIPNKEREFPLYFRGREDVYSKYAVYLLNKNIAQLRWYCGLSTPNLRATLPNLYSVLTSRLTIPGWPPSPSDSCELAEELTEETHQQLFRNDFSLSLDGGLDQISAVPPKPIAEVHLQSWLRSSFSDLEGVGGGGNAVPDGEIIHGRAQNRFLSGWKKKTYSESEDIDPRWLTNSLNLELDLGARGSNTPSPPLIVVSNSNEDWNLLKGRKRRVGRVESIPVFLNNCDNIIPRQNQANNAANNMLTIEPASTYNLTPARSMNEVELKINENERRRSICESGRGAGGSPGQSMLPGVDSAFLLTELPVVDNYPTTDEEKMDDTIADVVRKLSLMEMHLNRLPNNSNNNNNNGAPANNDGNNTSTSNNIISNNNSSLATVQEHSNGSSDDLHASSKKSSLDPAEEAHAVINHKNSNAAPSSLKIEKSSSSPDLGKRDPEEEQATTRTLEQKQQLDFFSTSDEIDKLSQALSDDTDQVFKEYPHNSPTSSSRPLNNISTKTRNNSKGSQSSHSELNNMSAIIETVNNCDPVNSSSSSGSSSSQPRTDIPTLFTERTCDKDMNISVTSTSNNITLHDSEEDSHSCNSGGSSSHSRTEQDDPSSLWFRTEALLTSQSFNMVKRRISESN